jgi:hypothetical protein
MKSKVRPPLDFGAANPADGSAVASADPAPQASPAPMQEAPRAPLPALTPDEAADLAIRPPPTSLQRLSPVQAEETDIGRGGYAAAIVFGVLWAGALVAFMLGMGEGGALQFGPLQFVILAVLAAAPFAMAILIAYALRQGAKLAAETRRAKAVAERMLGPALLAAADAGTAVDDVRKRIQEASAAAEKAKADLTSLRETVAAETRGLIEASQQASRSAETIKVTLGREREQMFDLAHSLDRQAVGVTEAVSRQARMVADASDLAQTQIREAEAALIGAVRTGQRARSEPDGTAGRPGRPGRPAPHRTARLLRPDRGAAREPGRRLDAHPRGRRGAGAAVQSGGGSAAGSAVGRRRAVRGDDLRRPLRARDPRPAHPRSRPGAGRARAVGTGGRRDGHGARAADLDRHGFDLPRGARDRRPHCDRRAG